MQGFIDEFVLKKFIKISLCFQDKCIFAIYPEIQDGHQKWWENVCWEKLPVDSAYTLWVKSCQNCSISLHFRDNCMIAAKSGRKMIFGGKSPVDYAYTLWIKNFVEIALSCSFSKKNLFLLFTQKFKIIWLPKVAGK